jgi:hypothetical protein
MDKDAGREGGENGEIGEFTSLKDLLSASGREERYPGGALRSILLLSETLVSTPLGAMVPNYSYDDARKKYAPSLSFYESGALRCVRLNEQKLVTIPGVGSIPCEKLLFYEGGTLKRLFPTDGKISGYWSVKDEKKLNREIDLSLKFGNYTLFISVLSFYETGELKSVTLWPGEDPELPLPGGEGKLRVGAGFSLYKNGDLQSA